MASAVPPSDTSDGDMPAVSNEELDIVWESVVRGDRSAGSKRTRSSGTDADDAASGNSSSASASGTAAGGGGGGGGGRLLFGLAAGDLSFEVPELRKRARHGERVPAEDGTWVEPGSDPTEGGRYGPQWREEAISRQQILEADPNFQFLSLVAGAANTRVDRLYDEDSVGEAMRARISEGQARLAAQEAQVESATLERSLAGMRTEQAQAERAVGRVAERQRTDGLLRAAPRHLTAVQTYVDLVRAREVRIDASNVLERWAAPAGIGVGAQRLMAADMGSLYRRVLEHILEEDDDMLGVGLGADEGLRPTTLALPLIFPRPAMVNPSARDALTNLFRRGFPQEVLLMASGGEGDPEGVADESAPPTLERALGRLLVLRALASDDILSARRAEVFSAFAVRLGTGDRQQALSQLTSVIDGEFRQAAIAAYRQTAWRQWRTEASAVSNVLESALLLLRLESPLASPSPGSTFKTSDEIAEEAAERAEQRARASGMSDAVALQEAQSARERVLENPPNRIMVRSNPVLGRYDRYALAVRPLLAQAERAEGIASLREAGVLGSPALDDDLAVLALARSADSGFSTEAERAAGTTGAARLTAWARAMSWYEDIGGTLFVDLTTDFPASDAMRAAQRAGREIVSWGVERRRPPTLYSAPMRALWDRHVPEMRAALEAVAQAVLAQSIVREGADPAALQRLQAAGIPRLTRVQRIVYTTLTGGIEPEQAAFITQDRVLTRGPLLVFAVRLYHADLAVARDALERAIEQRRTVMEATRDRLDKMARGQPVVRSVPEIPYQHRRGWVEQPEHSGVVRVLEIVVFAIGKAWNTLEEYASHITDVMTLEDAQRDPTMRVDFADLVAIRMAMSAQRFQKQWTPLKARAFNKMDLFDVVTKFQTRYDLRPANPERLPRQAAASRTVPGAVWRAQITPAPGTRRGRGGGGLLVL